MKKNKKETKKIHKKTQPQTTEIANMYSLFSGTPRFIDVEIQTCMSIFCFSILGFLQWQGKANLRPVVSLVFSLSPTFLSLHPAITSAQLPELVVGGESDLLTQVQLSCMRLREMVWEMSITTQLRCEICQIHLFPSTVWMRSSCGTGSLKNSNKDSKHGDAQHNTVKPILKALHLTMWTCSFKPQGWFGVWLKIKFKFDNYVPVCVFVPSHSVQQVTDFITWKATFLASHFMTLQHPLKKLPWISATVQQNVCLLFFVKSHSP